jgi:ribonuclease J
MRLRIHRGASEIGGSCVEVEHDGKRGLIDLGLPLDTKAHGVPLPAVKGLEKPDPGFLGIILSHPHQDHWGLVPDLRIFVSVYMYRRKQVQGIFFRPGPGGYPC